MAETSQTATSESAGTGGDAPVRAAARARHIRMSARKVRRVVDLVRDGTLRDWLAQVPDDRGGRSVPVGDVLAELVVEDVVHSE